MSEPALPACLQVVIVEDDDVARASLGAGVAATPGYALAAQFERAGPAMAWIERTRPDMLLVDLGLPDRSGIDVIRACAARWPDCAIMVITMFSDEKNVLDSIAAGATGYIHKDSGTLDVGRAMEELRQGGSPMSPLIARTVLARAAGRQQAQAAPLAHGMTLTPRETDTLDLIARGYTYEETARLLSVSRSTIQTHIRAIYGKLSVNSRGEAVFEAAKLGLLNGSLLRP